MAELEKPIKNLDQEVREMVSSLVSRLSHVQRSHKPAGSTAHDGDDDHALGGIITLAGNNTGATMRGELTNEADPQKLGPATENGEDFATYVNSNFQAVNNSIMLGGSYKTNDPGVHLDVSDYVESSSHEARRAAKKKGSDKYGSSKGEFRSDDSSSSSSG